jgi:diguanylate cyclase (GGDEF)-like protein/PAS domain S-box-containing protein
MLEKFFLLDPSLPFLHHGSHNPVLVVLSVGVAVLSSALALQLASLARQPSSPMQRQLTVVSGSLALGVGIWAMHFIGVLALHLPVRISFSLPLTFASLLPGLAASVAALWLLAQRQPRPVQLLTASVLMALGIGTMHYSGMAALQMGPLLRYDPVLFALSLLVAWLLAGLALWVRFGLARLRWLSGLPASALAALCMGGAISGMHYTAIAATRLVGQADADTWANDAWFVPLALAVGLTTAALSTAVGGLNGLQRYRALYRQARLNEARLSALVDTAVDSIVMIDQRGLIQSFNRSAERIFGWRQEEVLGRNISMLMPEPYSSQHDAYLARYMRTAEPHIIGIGREVLGLHKDGSTMPMRLAVGRIDVPGGPLFVGFLMDLRQLKKAQEQLHIAASVFEHSYEATLILDRQRRIVNLNPAFARTTGQAPEASLQRPLEHFYPDTDFAPIWQAIGSEGHWRGELARHSGSGARLVERVSMAAVGQGSGAAHHFIAVISDITQAKAHEQELEHIALYDSLTGLPNRRLLTDRLQQALRHAERSQQLLAVCYLDLDGFKQVNDQHGHEAGDLLLIEVGQRIQALLRADDTLARLGGDEMVLLLGSLPDPEACLPVLQRVQEAIRQPVRLPTGAQVQVSCSMGLSFYPLDGNTPDLLLRQSDHAMYQAKQGGKNQCRRFAPEGSPPG